MKSFDSIELVGRAFKVPSEGLIFTKISNRYTVFPVQTSERIYNHSRDGSFYIFAAEFGTFIIPFVFGIIDILKSAQFKRVSADVLSAYFSSEYMPVGTRNQATWYHMVNVIHKHNAIIARDLLKSKGEKLKNVKPLDFLDSVSTHLIPFTGIYDNAKGRIFYPMASIKFPHVDIRKLGKYNIDPNTHRLILYAVDGNTYLLNDSRIDEVKRAGYILDSSLYVPN